MTFLETEVWVVIKTRRSIRHGGERRRVAISAGYGCSGPVESQMSISLLRASSSSLTAP